MLLFVAVKNEMCSCATRKRTKFDGRESGCGRFQAAAGETCCSAWGLHSGVPHLGFWSLGPSFPGRHSVCQGACISWVVILCTSDDAGSFGVEVGFG
jgi:hypothetical protein